jgi:hypothetical protein
MNELLDPSELTLTDSAGKERIYILSKFPAVQGREIIAKYPMSNMPKVGDYAVSEEIMLKLMSFVAVDAGGKQLRLSTRALVDNHVDSWETLAKIEMAMMEKNCSFFRDGTAFTFFEGAVRNMLAKISAILTPSSAPSSPPPEKQPSTSFAPSIQ